MWSYHTSVCVYNETVSYNALSFLFALQQRRHGTVANFINSRDPSAIDTNTDTFHTYTVAAVAFILKVSET